MTHVDDPQDTLRAAFWKPALSIGKGPRYLRLAAWIEQAVADGRLRPGDRLPSQRELATWLGIDFTTVTRAYTEARERRAIEGRGPLGTFVSSPQVAFEQMLDLGMNIPPAPEDMYLGQAMKEGVGDVLTHTDASMLMAYQLGGGSAADRHAGALWLAPMLGDLDEAMVAVSPGAQAALAALILSTTRPGDVILAEPLVYPGLRTAATTLERRIEAVDMDADGMRPDALLAAARLHGARLVYLNPTLQNPTAHTMPLKRRRELLAVAEQHDLKIIEDDPYWRLATDAPPPLARLAPQRVYYVATLSKCLTPGLRTAYAVLPEARMRERFLAALNAFALMAPPLMTGLATQWIHNGTADRILAGVRAAAKTRQQLAAGILGTPGGATKGKRATQEGIHLWHPLPAAWKARELTLAARTEGLAVVASDAFSLRPDAPDAIRISLGGVRDEAQLTSALKRLKGLLDGSPQGQTGALV